MGFLSSLVGGGVMGAAEGVANIIDKFVETDDEKRAFEALKIRMAQESTSVQAEINKIEAGHRSIFVAGWRPFVGWVSAIALAWHFLGFDLTMWITGNWFPEAVVPQLTGTDNLMSVLFAMLGIGGFRTIEKLNGKAK